MTLQHAFAILSWLSWVRGHSGWRAFYAPLQARCKPVAHHEHLSPAARSLLLSRIRLKDEWPEHFLDELLSSQDLGPYVHNARNLPGAPTFAFKRRHVAVFVDADFWYGRAFQAWSSFLPDPWRRRITANVMQAKRCDVALRAMGWAVVHIWENDLKKDPRRCLKRVAAALGEVGTRFCRNPHRR